MAPVTFKSALPAAALLLALACAVPHGAAANPTLVGYTQWASADTPNFVDATEQVAIDAHKMVAYGIQGTNLDVLDLQAVAANAATGMMATAPNMPVLLRKPQSAAIQDVAYCKGKSGAIVAIVTEGVSGKLSPGNLIIYSTANVRDASPTLPKLGEFTVGALPDQMHIRKEDGECAYVFVANEGEPLDYTGNVDPEGSVSVVTLSWSSPGVLSGTVATADFTAFNNKKDELIADGVRIFGPGATVAQDLEPECVATSKDLEWAFASLQENNAIAIISLRNKHKPKVTSVVPLGLVNYTAGNAADNKFDPTTNLVVDIGNWPVYGLYAPDEIKSFTHDGDTYLVTANEGDAREWPGITEVVRVNAATLDTTVFPNAADLKQITQLGRLQISTAGQTSPIKQLVALNSRSFSILKMHKNGKDFTRVYDSGPLLEQETANVKTISPIPNCPSVTGSNQGRLYNAGNDNTCFDSRSPNKGPEPEGLDIAYVGGKRILALTLERSDRVAIFDISSPKDPRFRYFLAPPESADPSFQRWVGPEGVAIAKVPIAGGAKKTVVFTAWEVGGLFVSGGVTAHLLG